MKAFMDMADLHTEVNDTQTKLLCLPLKEK